MTRVRLYIALIITVYPFFLSVADEVKVDWQNTVSIPVSEVAYKVNKWMRNSGILIEQSALKNGVIRIVGSGGVKNQNETWLIELTPPNHHLVQG